MTELDDEKKFYERFWALLSNRDLMRVFESYGPLAFRRSSVLEGFEKFIDGHGFGGRLCVEIGTLKGLTAIVLARRFDKVVTLDILDDPFRATIAAMLGIKNVEFITIKDNTEKAAIISKLSFDAAYLDGDHVHDTESDFAVVQRCGRVLFHEYWEAQPAVVRAVGALTGIVAEGKFALWRRK
jgi:hypothetical protein